MSKTSSGLFLGTLGEQADLEEDYYTRYLSDGGKVLDVRALPGSSGMKVPQRLSPEQMMFLTEKYEVEFAQVYELGPGRNGGGGQYYIYSGTRRSVTVPISSTTILISHTHPGDRRFRAGRTCNSWLFSPAWGLHKRSRQSYRRARRL